MTQFFTFYEIIKGGPIRKVDPNGDFEVEQMYVQYIIPADQKSRYPLLMWHGGGLTGVTWETKPDGNPGWMQYFLKQGTPYMYRMQWKGVGLHGPATPRYLSRNPLSGPKTKHGNCFGLDLRAPTIPILANE